MSKETVNLISKIRKGAFHFEATTGKRPTGVYLGHEDWDEVMASEEVKQLFSCSPPGPIEQKLYGMTVYVVNRTRHIGFGFGFGEILGEPMKPQRQTAFGAMRDEN